MQAPGYFVGRLISCLFLPILVLLCIGVIQYIRTRDTKQAFKAVISWWALLIAFVCMLLSVLGQWISSFGS